MTDVVYNNRNDIRRRPDSLRGRGISPPVKERNSGNMGKYREIITTKNDNK